MRQLAAAGLVALWAYAAPAQEMTKAEEAAYTALWQMSSAALARRGGGDLAGAETLFADVLTLIERDLPGEALVRASALHNLAAVRAELGRLAEAEAMAREALSIREAKGGTTTAIASSKRLLSSILRDLERADEARDLLDSAIRATMADPEADGTYLLEDLTTMAVMMAEAGEAEGAMGLMGQLEPMLRQMTAPDAARTYLALGRVQSLAGQPVLAEAAYREALARSVSMGADEPRWTLQDRVTVIGNLASMLLAQGREREAEPLFKQALAMAGNALPLLRANLLDGLGAAQAAGGALQAAYDAERAALDLRLAVLPADHAQLAASFARTGETVLRAGEPAIARDALKKALAIAEARGDGLRAARAGLMLAAAEAALGIPSFDRAKAAEVALSGLLPAGRPELAGARFIAASLALNEGRAGEALPLAQAALADIVPRLQRAGADATVASAGAGDLRQMVLPVLSAAWAVDPETQIDMAFQAAQWATVTRASRATQRMAARTAAASGELATLARGKQDLVNRWQEADRAYVAALGKGRGQAEGAVLAGLDSEIATADAALAAQFPDYAALVTPKALSIAEVQKRLTPGEVLVMIVPAPTETFVFAITPDAAHWHRADLGAGALEDAVRHLRADLDPTGPARSAVALDATEPKGKGFDRGAAFALNTALLAPVAGMLPEGGRVLVVADGGMASLPLAVLVASAPEGDDADPVALQATDWQARHHAFATLPSVQALAGLRDRGAGAARGGFLGFGAPDFAGGGTVDVGAVYDGARGRAEAVRALPPLPGTRRELLELAKQMGVGTGALRLGAEATEAAVKATNFAGAGVVAFATHGLIAGDIRGLAEPALAFTPPAMPDDDDDGLLTASEAGQLRLSADWVILSACNTAAPDGTPGAEGLSGLAAAFLYAGARGLLVSHWPVGDAAAERLTQGAVARLAADPALGQAGALAAAMENLRADPAFAHPSAWAPFVVVGDGR